MNFNVQEVTTENDGYDHLKDKGSSPFSSNEKFRGIDLIRAVEVSNTRRRFVANLKGRLCWREHQTIILYKKFYIVNETKWCARLNCDMWPFWKNYIPFNLIISAPCSYWRVGKLKQKRCNCIYQLLRQLNLIWKRNLNWWNPFTLTTFTWFKDQQLKVRQILGTFNYGTTILY